MTLKEIGQSILNLVKKNDRPKRRDVVSVKTAAGFNYPALYRQPKTKDLEQELASFKIG